MFVCSCIQMEAVTGSATPVELSSDHPYNERGLRTWVTSAQWDKICAEPTMVRGDFEHGKQH